MIQKCRGLSFTAESDITQGLPFGRSSNGAVEPVPRYNVRCMRKGKSQIALSSPLAIFTQCLLYLQNPAGSQLDREVGYGAADTISTAMGSSRKRDRIDLRTNQVKTSKDIYIRYWYDGNREKRL